MKCEMLRPNLFSSYLVDEKTTIWPDHTFCCFFIVQHTDNMDFIHKLAFQLRFTCCRDFNFFGVHEPLWHQHFDDIAMKWNPWHEKIVAITSGWATLDSFVDAMYLAVSTRCLFPNDVYLLYDDRLIYEEAMRLFDVCDSAKMIAKLNDTMSNKDR